MSSIFQSNFARGATELSAAEKDLSCEFRSVRVAVRGVKACCYCTWSIENNDVLASIENHDALACSHMCTA